jgi:hypothetical protein
MPKGTLIAAMNIGRAAEDEFQDWYDTEHLPERQRVPGFLACERWIGVDDRRISLATYDLESVTVLQSPGYLAIGGENLSPWSKRVTSQVDRLMRFEGDQILPGEQLPPAKAGGLLLNAMNIAPELEAEFNEWYDKEHIPALAAVPGVLAARFRGTGNRDVALCLARPRCRSRPSGSRRGRASGRAGCSHFRDHLRLVTRRYVRGLIVPREIARPSSRLLDTGATLALIDVRDTASTTRAHRRLELGAAPPARGAHGPAHPYRGVRSSSATTTVAAPRWPAPPWSAWGIARYRC